MNKGTLSFYHPHFSDSAHSLWQIDINLGLHIRLSSTSGSYSTISQGASFSLSKATKPISTNFICIKHVYYFTPYILPYLTNLKGTIDYHRVTYF